MKAARPEIVSAAEHAPSPELQPSLVLPEENYDDHPLMKRYAKISEQALKNSQSDLEDGAADDTATPIG